MLNEMEILIELSNSTTFHFRCSHASQRKEQFLNILHVSVYDVPALLEFSFSYKKMPAIDSGDPPST